MKEFSITGTVREGLGKKATRELRKQDIVPCNIYGVEKNDNGPVAVAFTVPMTDLRKLIYTPNVYIVNLNLNGKEVKAIIKEIQFHPTSDKVLHVDFYQITEDKDIVIGVPVKLNGLAEGVRAGGRLNLSIRTIKVKAKYTAIPDVLDIDVTPLQIGKSIKVGQLQFEGLQFATSPEVVVCSIKATRKSIQAANAQA
ncbi:MAG: 50S ribosomal protein L25/general stress protein Ctc [Prevotella sp.]|nr:50S ribosomal protein L25/general stress protein Ctc [Prevotella sp.]MCF0193124.1 50S ribosomal protein L25/general stress protein Ctc [Prevotella sp.]